MLLRRPTHSADDDDEEPAPTTLTSSVLVGRNSGKPLVMLATVSCAPT